MKEHSEQIFLKGGKYHITERGSDAFRVLSGSVLVYIVPVTKNGIGRRSFIYEAHEGELIPGFCYKDIDYRNWRFCLVALDEAQMEVTENGATGALREAFSKKAEIRNYSVEGYDEGLVDRYRTNTVIEDGFIRRSQNDRKEISSDIQTLIKNSINRKSDATVIEKTGDPLYDSVALICSRYNISLASYEKVREAFGNSFSIEDIAEVSDIICREVSLEPGWENKDSGPLIVTDETGKTYACLPKGKRSYILYDVTDDSAKRVTKETAEKLSSEAVAFCRALPARILERKDIITFCMRSVRTVDIILLFVISVLTAITSVLLPTLSIPVIDEYIPSGSVPLMLQTGCVLASLIIANALFSVLRKLIRSCMTGKMSNDMQNAVLCRLFSLPDSFFRRFESADLAQRVLDMDNTVNTIATNIITSIIASIFVLAYIIRMALFSGTMTLICVLTVLAYAGSYYLISLPAIRHQKDIADLKGRAGSAMTQFLSGITKIRMSGSEDRALYEYLRSFVSLCDSEEKRKNIVNTASVMTIISNSVFSVILYLIIINGNTDISPGTFIAFAFMLGSLVSFVMQTVRNIIGMKSVMPDLKRLQPIFDEDPEHEAGKDLPGDITGEIEINNIRFAYSDGLPNVIEDLDLKIRAGEYVGIVGPSGCGKSALVRLLLGFEKPVSGKIYYDNKDIDSLDKRALRRKMGVVLQDGKLISGSISENIAVTSPGATLEDVRRAVNAVGLDKEISDMPMGLNTVLSEDSESISGGQRQRILIARAVISDPQIIIFDEATSSLDNASQMKICDMLGSMNATRIVIAHRISTIMKCDRIIVMDSGRIAEQGTYDELMKKKGLFFRLAGRQVADM